MAAIVKSSNELGNDRIYRPRLLECCVRIEGTNTSNRRAVISSRKCTIQVKETRERETVLHATFGDSRKFKKATYVLKECKIHTNNIRSGRASIEIRSSAVVILLTNCAPERLATFLKEVNIRLGGPQKSNVAQIINRTSTRYGIVQQEPQLLPPPQGSKMKTKTNSTDKDENCLKKKRLHSGGQLSAQEKRVVRIIFEQKQSMFFTGSAGTGKSVLLKKIVGWLPAATTFITAATGVAACQLGGVTLHSFAGIGTGELPINKTIGMINEKNALLTQWRSCTHLIIDEISMVGADYFEKIEEVARRIRGSKLPFGGIQLIVTGDFLQLPPVVKPGESVKFCFQTQAWSRSIKQTVLLRKVHRQSDQRFVEILNQLRIGKCNQEATEAIQNTRINWWATKSDVVATKLCTHTKDADRVNKRRLEMLNGRSHYFEAEDEKTIPEDLNKVVPKKIALKIGAQVMLTKNIDLTLGLSNGSRGSVQSFTTGGYPVVKFIDKKCPVAGIEIKPCAFAVRSKSSDGFAVRNQIPLKLAWAISIHKSQGLTLDAIEVCLSQVFADGQAYVALSRAKSLDSLCVIGFDSMSVSANEDVVQYYMNLEKTETLMEIP